MKRRVITTIDHDSVLWLLDDLVNLVGRESESLTVEDRPRIDIDGIFYATMIQAGVEEFLSFNHAKTEFLEARTSDIAEEWLEALKRVQREVARLLPNDKKRTLQGVSPLTYFLADLSIAVEKKSAVVLMQGLPDPRWFERFVSPEFGTLVQNLLATIETDDTKLPIPKNFICADDFQAFEQTISSDLFQRYATIHRVLEDGTTPKKVAMVKVASAGRALSNSNRKILEVKKTLVSLIPVTSKIIDVVFGKLPGVLADFFGQRLSEMLKDDRRIVIYRFDPISTELLRKYGPPFYREYYDALLKLETNN